MKRMIVLALMVVMAVGAFAQENIYGSFSASLRPGNSSTAMLHELDFQDFEIDDSRDTTTYTFTFSNGDVTMEVVVNGSPEEEYMELKLQINGRPYSTSVMAYGGPLETLESDAEFGFTVMEEISLGANTMSTPTSYRLEEGSYMSLINEGY